MQALETEKLDATTRAEVQAKANMQALFLWAKAANGPYHGLLLDDLSEEQQQAYELHRMVVDRYRGALQAERRERLFPAQRRLLSELRNAQPDPDRHIAAALTDEIRTEGIALDIIGRISELMRRLLDRIVAAVDAHSLRYWTREDGGHKWDVATARLCLGSAELVDLEARAEREAKELRATEPAFSKLADRDRGLDQ